MRKLLLILTLTWASFAKANLPAVCRKVLQAAEFLGAKWSEEITSVGEGEFDVLWFPHEVARQVPSPEGKHDLISGKGHTFFRNLEFDQNEFSFPLRHRDGARLYWLKPQSLELRSDTVWLGMNHELGLIIGKRNLAKWSMGDVAKATFFENDFVAIAMNTGELRIASVKNGEVLAEFPVGPQLENAYYQPFLAVEKEFIAYQPRLTDTLYIFSWNAQTRGLTALAQGGTKGVPVTGGEWSSDASALALRTSHGFAVYLREKDDWRAFRDNEHEEIAALKFSADSSSLMVAHQGNSLSTKRVVLYDVLQQKEIGNYALPVNAGTLLYAQTNGQTANEWILFTHKQTEEERDSGLHLWSVGLSGLTSLGQITGLPRLEYIEDHPTQKWLQVGLRYPTVVNNDDKGLVVSHLFIRNHFFPDKGTLETPRPHTYTPNPEPLPVLSP